MSKYEPNEWDKYYMESGKSEPEPETVDEMMGLILDILSAIGFGLLAFVVYKLCVSLGA